MALVQANFGTMQTLIDDMARVSGKVETLMANWSGVAAGTEAVWLDEAGGMFAMVKKEWDEISALQQEMLARLRLAVIEGQGDFAATLNASVTAVGGG